MPAILNGRFAAQIEGDFVVFLIGMRVNRFWLLHNLLPVAGDAADAGRTGAPS